MSHAELAETIGLVVPLIYFVMLAIEWRWPACELGVIAVFAGPVDRRMGAMLAFGDVNAAAYGAGTVGAKPLGTAP